MNFEAQVNSFDGNPGCVLTVLLLRFALFLSELRNAMLLQEGTKVNISRAIDRA